MTVQLGLRERKKQRTRQDLINAAVRLFGENGFDETAVADIAAAAEVSTRTFFLHFPTKEAIVFANSNTRFELGLEILASRRPGESMRHLVVRAMNEMIDDVAGNDLQSGMGSLRVRLLISSQSLREALCSRFFAAEAELASKLQEAYPGQLDSIDASAMMGAVIGAVYAAALRSVIQDDSPIQLREAMQRSVRIAAKCIPQVKGRPF